MNLILHFNINFGVTLVSLVTPTIEIFLLYLVGKCYI